MRNLSIDIETFSTIDIKKAGAYRYALDAEVMLFGYSVDFAEPECIDLMAGEEIPDQIVKALFDPDVKKSAHNAAFERAVLHQYFKRLLYLRYDHVGGLPEWSVGTWRLIGESKGYLPPEQWQCTQVMCARAGYPLDLDSASMALGTADKKDKKGRDLIRLFSVPCKPTKSNSMRTRNLPEHFPDRWLEFISYCEQDVRTEQAIAKKLEWIPVLPEEEIYWHENEKMNERGLRIDMDLVRGAVAIDEIHRERLLEEARSITGLENPNSRDQMLSWLNEEGDITAETLTKESVKEMMGETEDEKVKRVLELRQEISKSSIRKYAAMEASVCPDGRVRGTVQFNGAPRTGRAAGRLIQIQNFARISMPDESLDIARNIAIAQDRETLEMFFGSVPSTLSQLLRTAIVAGEGKRLLVCDFSAVEARVIAWLAGEDWVLDVFAGHGKIYEATASKMFSVPFESITKDSELRQRGKVAVLALGFQGGVNALTTMDLDKKIPDEDKPGLVKMFRKANPNIVRFWYDLDKAARNAIKYPGDVFKVGKKGVAFSVRKNVLLMRLPSGRLLHYPKPFLTLNRFGNESIGFWGMEQQSRKWAKTETYGGKLAENCLAGDTLVLTNSGWKPIPYITTDDLLWDGVEWVNNGGSIFKLEKQTLSLNGIRMTGDHKILTENGWTKASLSKGLNWSKVELPYRDSVCGKQREKVNVEGEMCLWENSNHDLFGYREDEAEVLRMQTERANRESEYEARHDSASHLLDLAFDGRSVQASYTPSVAQLRGEGYSGLREVEIIREFLGRHGADLQKGAHSGSDRRERELRAGELSVGYYETARTKQEEQHSHRHSLGPDYGRGSGGEIRDRKYDPALSPEPRGPLPVSIREGRRSEPVWDILNAGPRNRFTVRAEDGTPVIVHNCTQAVARDLLFNGQHQAIQAGYHVIANIHDEIICEEDVGFGSPEELAELMCKKLDWMGDLPLKAVGQQGKYYSK